ncbi:hypothetical protein FOCC_FOCC013132 [Frankliniella occidentalis]|nr:hypothetical protein FOCC_FOCC013132 [Frankliniella occidentalis]
MDGGQILYHPPEEAGSGAAMGLLRGKGNLSASCQWHESHHHPGPASQLPFASPYSSRLLKNPDQGKVARIRDWRFIHRARLGVLPLNGCKRWLTEEAARRCRRGCPHLESTAHVLNHCPSALVAGQRRHNAIQKRLEDAEERYTQLQLRVNQTLPFSLRTPGVLPGDASIQRQRPDLVLIDSLHRVVTLVDVTIPFEDGWESFQAARATKVRTYQPACDLLAANGWTATIDALWAPWGARAGTPPTGRPSGACVAPTQHTTPPWRACAFRMLSLSSGPGIYTPNTSQENASTPPPPPPRHPRALAELSQMLFHSLEHHLREPSLKEA